MTENLAPADSYISDNSSPEPVSGTGTSIGNEPEIQDETAERQDTQEQEKPKDKQEKLYANKYKSVEELEKGYKEAEKFISKAAELEKQVSAYKEQESKLHEWQQALQNGYVDTQEMAIDNMASMHEFNLFANALELGYAGEHYNQAYEALFKYGQTGDVNDLNAAKMLFSPDILERIAQDKKAFKDQKILQFNQDKYQTLFNNIKENLQDFVKGTGDWINPPQRQDVISLLLGEFGTDLDLNRAKEVIEQIENGAIEMYKTNLKANQEQQSRAEQMQAPTGVSGAATSPYKNTDWRQAQSDADMKKIVSKYL